MTMTMTMTTRTARITAVGALIALAGVTTTTSATAAAASPQSRAVVPITIQGGQGTSSGAHPMVEVSVGTSEPVPILLDTGSTGLQIFDTVVKTGTGSGVTVTDQPDRITYAGGHRLTGVVANAKVTIGSQTTAQPVAFGLVQDAVCIPSKPTCPVAGGIPAAMARGFYGILGIGMNHGPNGLASPILGMPGGLGRSWSIHLSGTSGSLVLGAALPRASKQEITVQLVSRGTAGTDRFWDDIVHLCVVVGPAGECAPGIFDSGTYSMQLSPTRWAKAPLYPGTSLVVAGTPVSVFLLPSGVPLWSFTAGVTKSADTVTVPVGGSDIVNTGVAAYYAFTISYDVIHGVIGLAATPA